MHKNTSDSKNVKFHLKVHNFRMTVLTVQKSTEM